jgi:hypothetical protein
MRKKLNKQQQLAKRKARLARIAIGDMRQALMGTTLSYNRTWGEFEAMYPSNFDKALKLAKGNGELLFQILETWEFDWDALLTIYCTGTKKYDQPATIKISAHTAIEMAKKMELEALPKVTAKVNHQLMVEWGFMATITQYT